ncbi:hypothetical protein N7540_004695 [Penicillium herquei]|nr:hypothetical protein N7540_004695 [Penicillium herquei]
MGPVIKRDSKNTDALIQANQKAATEPIFGQDFTDALSRLLSANQPTGSDDLDAFQAEPETPDYPPPSTTPQSLSPQPFHTVTIDFIVYLIVKTVSQTERGNHWPDVFTKAGDIKVGRDPQDPAPLAQAFGLPFFFVYKDYYVLCRKAHKMATESIKSGPKRPTSSEVPTISPWDPSLPPPTSSPCLAKYFRILAEESSKRYDVVRIQHDHGTIFWKTLKVVREGLASRGKRSQFLSEEQSHSRNRSHRSPTQMLWLFDEKAGSHNQQDELVDYILNKFLFEERVAVEEDLFEAVGGIHSIKGPPGQL